MQLINQSHSVITEPDPYRIIELAGRTCYKSEDKITPESSTKFVKMLTKRGHLSVLEHASIIFQVPSTVLPIIYSIKKDWDSSKIKYLNISNDNVPVVSGNLRAWLEFLGYKSLPYNPHLKAIAHYLGYRFPEIFKSVEKSSARVTILVEEDLTDIEQQIHCNRTVRFITDRGACYDNKTEVLTQDGFKLFKDVTSNDAVWTLNPNTKLPEYQTPKKHYQYDWDGELIGGKSTMVDFLLTPNHRMFYFPYDVRVNRDWKIATAEQIYNKRIKFHRGLFHPWEGTPIIETFPQQASLPFARFLGMFITDGSKSKLSSNGGKITLHQTKEAGRKYIKNFLTQLDWKYSEKDFGFVIHDTMLYHFMSDNFTQVKHVDGRVPYWVKEAPVDYIKHFMSGVIKGDGNTHKTNGHQVIYTTNKKLADDYQECIIRMGLCSSIRLDDRTGQERILKGKIIRNTKPCYIVSITTRTKEHLFNKVNWYKKHYTGKVYCVEVPNGIIYVRRNEKAFWSGNSHELVRHRPCAFSQESTRYVRYDGDMEFIKPVWYETQKVNIMTKFRNACNEAESYYQDFIGYGWRPEQARTVLPNSLKTEIVMTATLSEWKHIFKLRCSDKAHPQMKALMRPLSIDPLMM